MRSKFNDQGISLKTNNVGSPMGKARPRSPQKTSSYTTSITLRTVIGTTTSSPTGLSCHADSKTFAICAGSLAVLSRLHENGTLSQTFFRARPTVSAVNPITSVYNATPTLNTPERRPRSIPPLRLPGLDATPTNSPRQDRAYDGARQTWTARERIKAASSVSISPNGNFLAIGETGYNPRVMIFPTDEDAPHDRPLSIINEHSFGVRAVAFSPESQYLATLGDANDGFLFIWIINPKTGAVRLHSTNKCTSKVYDMAWCGSTLITAGTRHVKVWRLSDETIVPPTKSADPQNAYDSPASSVLKTLAGRNCLLGPLVDSTFTCLVPISKHEVILCTNRGKICLYNDDSGLSQGLKMLKDTGSPIYSVTASQSKAMLWFGDGRGGVACENIERLKSPHASREQTPICPPSPDPPFEVSAFSSKSGSSPRPMRQRGGSVALGCLQSHLVVVDSGGSIQIQDVDGASPSTTLPSNTGAVQGLASLAENSHLGAFFSWSRNGDVRFWDVEGSILQCRKIEVEQAPIDGDDCGNELRILRISTQRELVISGDRFGVLKIHKGSDWTPLHEARAHGAEIADIAAQEDECLLIATCSRDRMVQLFQKSAQDLKLLQTMDEHVGSVCHVLFMQEGAKLLSSSSDRTIIVRTRVKRDMAGMTTFAYLSNRVITLKAAPLCMSSVPGEAEVLVVSTMDRQLVTLVISSGAVIDSFKASNVDNDETVTLNSIKTLQQNFIDGPRLLVGYSSIDKSIRVYDLDRRTLVTRESGHTEGVSDVILLTKRRGTTTCKPLIASAGLDGVIMLWDLALHRVQSMSTPLQEVSQGPIGHEYDCEGTPIRGSTMSRPPLRKVLSTFEIVHCKGDEISSGSPTPLGGQSLPGIRKKSSRHNLTTRKPHIRDSPPLPSPGRTQTGTDDQRRLNRVASPSPPPALPRHAASNIQHMTKTRSPSSSAAGPSQARRSSQSASTNRLRRPPSIPSNLRSQTSGAVRRKSLGNVSHEVNNFAMTSEQLRRTLRAYRKKLAAISTSDQINLDEVEVELLATLRCVEERMKTMTGGVKAVGVSELESLAALIQNTAIGRDATLKQKSIMGSHNDNV